MYLPRAHLMLSKIYRELLKSTLTKEQNPFKNGQKYATQTGTFIRVS
jgi:hypothetical protein